LQLARGGDYEARQFRVSERAGSIDDGDPMRKIIPATDPVGGKTCVIHGGSPAL